MMLRDYFEMGWIVVAVCCGYEDEYSIAEGDDFEDLPVWGFDDEECEAYEIDEAEHRVYVRVRDEDD